MDVIIKRIPESTLEEFADYHGFTMMVYERNTGNPDYRFYAQFDRVGVLYKKMFRGGVYGNGRTPDEAIADYCTKISNQVLIIGWGINQKEIAVPKITRVR